MRPHKVIAPGNILSTRTRTRSLLVQRIVRIKHAGSAELTPAARCILRSLADHAGESAECWPAVRRLAADAGISVRQTQRILRQLQATGWISSRPRWRPDGSQTSAVYVWHDTPVASPSASCTPPDTHVTPPLTSTSPHEKHRDNSPKKHDVRDVVCVNGAPAAEQHDTPVESAPPPAPAAEPSPVLPLPADPDTPVAATATVLGAVLPAVLMAARSAAAPAAAPVLPAGQVRRRWLTIDPARLSDGRYCLQCHADAVAAGLLVNSESCRLTWLAAWCEVLSKSRRGLVRNPAATLRWLCDNPKALAAYASQESEDKARRLLRQFGHH